MPHGAKTYLAATLAQAAVGERLVWIARDAEIADRVAEELGAWLGDPEAVAVLEPRTALAYERSELIADETAARVAALAAWQNGRARILVAGVQSLLQHTIDPADLPRAPRELRVGSRLHQDALLRELFDLGYVPVSEVAGRGESARRGGIVDVFPPSMALPIRIEFFGDEIDSLRSFDPTDQRTTTAIQSAVLLPASEFLLPAGGAAAIRDRLGRAAARLPERLAADLARFDTEPLQVAAGGEASRAMAVGDAAEVWAAHLAPATGLDHIGPGTLLVLDEPGDIAEAAGFLWRQADERRAELVEAGELPKDWPATYLPPRDWKNRLVASRTLELTWESVPPEDAAMARGALSSGDPFGWREPVLPPGRAGRLVEAVEAWRADDDRIVLASDQAPRLADVLGEAGHPVAVVGRVGEAPPPGAIALIERSLNGGFIGGPDGLAFVTDRELFGTVRIRRPKALRRVVPRDILERLSPGDLVVHIDHGVARYEQMLRRGGAGEDRDYLELSFAGGDRIFVPVEQIGRVTRYSGGERPALSKLGGTEWLRAKQRVRKAVDDLAEELLALYASRANAQGHAFGPDTPWQSEMEASFPYEETIDQLRAAAEVKADMELTRPMDRLVVGDVGYGKTEVALRAAFKAVQDGKQVAVLVPTTVLAAQHDATFSQRFAAFPIEVRLLSRFVSATAQAATLEGLADGTVDIVIGTHRLLSKDVRFKDLGLVVVDEEQRFGVAAKERLKQLKREVDVLTLSATPIPRTLNLALAGIRDLSVIETPPEDRLPIQTRVAEASAGLVRDAILRELDRGGQVFYVHNRVETIEAQAEQLRRMLPGVRFVVGHGQMARGRAREGDDRVRRRRGRRPGLHDDHRIGARHPERQHDRHRPRRHARARPALPAPRAGRPVGAAGLRVPPLPTPRAALGRGPQAPPGDLQRVRARRRVPDRAVRPRDPRGRQHPRRRAVRAHGGGRLRPLLAAAGRRRRVAQGIDGGPRADRRGAAGRRRPAGRGPPPRRVRPRRGPEARALPPAGPGALGRRPGRVPPGGPRPLRPDARPGDAPDRGRRAADGRRGGGRRLDLARGGLARGPLRGGPHAGDRHAPAGRPTAARSARE